MATKEQSFVHLTTQSSFTPGALGNVQQYARDARIFGMPAVGVADAHSVAIWDKHEEACHDHDLKPLFGITLSPQVDGAVYPVSLLVQEEAGFHSIYQLAHLNQGTITFDDLLAHQQGLIAIAPEPSHEILKSEFDPKKLFFEYLNFDTVRSRIHLTQQMKRAQRMNAQVVVTNRVWKSTPRLYDQFLSLALYAHKTKQTFDPGQFTPFDIAENRQVHGLIGRSIRDQHMVNGLSPFHPEGWLKPPSMMRGLMGQKKSNQHDEWIRACDNTVNIAQMCEPEELPRASMPEYLVPEGHTVYSYLYERCLQALPNRYPEITQEITDRLEREMHMIGERSLESMFLIVGDITDFARTQMLTSGVGSATGSLVCYLLGITNVDPIKHNLLFERFLGPVESVKPDIDIQVDADKAKVAALSKYLFSHFPPEGIYVAYISTMGTYRMDGSIDLLLKTFGYSKDEAAIIREAAQSLEQRRLYERVNRHPSKVIFSDRPFEETHFVMKSKSDGNPQVGEDKDDVKRHHEMEFDYVKSHGLTLLDRVLNHHGLRREEIPHEVNSVLQDIFHSHIIGIPGIETPWLRTVLHRYGQMKQWENLTEQDLYIAFALSRPNVGNDYRELFYQQLKTGKPFSYENEIIDEILSESYGVAVFQEQLMRLVSAIGEFDDTEADVLRRQISKERDPVTLQAAASSLHDQALAKGVPQEKVLMLVDQMMHFLRYGFVKGHAIELMSNIAYELAYLKSLDAHAFIAEVERLGKGHYYKRGNPEAYEYEKKRIAGR